MGIIPTNDAYLLGFRKTGINNDFPCVIMITLISAGNLHGSEEIPLFQVLGVYKKSIKSHQNCANEQL